MKSDFEKLALRQLFEAIREKTPETILEAGSEEIQSRTTRISVSAVIEREVTQADKYICAIQFITKLTQRNDSFIAFGSVGIDADRDTALQTAVNEWVAYVGESLSLMISASDVAILKGDFIFFPSPVGLRGQRPSKEWMDLGRNSGEIILSAIAPVLQKTFDEFFPIIVIVANNKGHVTGECRVKNKISDKLLERIKELDWKDDSAAYMYKQFFIARPIPAQGDP